MKFALAFLAVVGMACALPTQRSGLKNDIDDFLALIPKEELVALYHKYENDADVQKVVAYLKSSDFASVMHIIAHVDEVQDLVKYLEGQGVPVVDVLNKLADRLGLPNWPTDSNRFALKSTRSIRDFINEAKALLPVEKLVALAMDKLANSESFQNLYMKISELDYQKLHDAAISHPEIVDLLARLNNLGVDTKKIWETIKSLFGWTYSSRSVFATKGLKEDLDEFFALIPTEKFIEMFHKYENDPEVQELFAYLKSSDFATILHIIANVDEVREIVDYLESQGVPVIDTLNKLADRLGFPQWPTTYSNHFALKSTRSLRDIINEALALVPFEKLVALALDKLANSEAIQNLYMKIAMLDYQKLHDAALSHPEIVDLLTRLNNLGFDTKKAWETIKSLFGWTYSSRSVFATKGLKDDLDDFLALIPTQKLIDLYHKYENDPDVQGVVAYLKSSDFASVMHIIANVDEVREIVNYLESQGVPVIDALNKLADRLGLPHWPTTYSNRFSLRSTRSIRDFINEAKALLPVEKLVALALDKLANSEAFQNLYTKISELDYQKLHDAALSHPEIVDLLARLNNLGVDTKKIWETIKSLFGWTYSSRSVFATKGLKDDLDDFLALIPTQKLIDLYHKYENDPDVQRVVAYLKSSDFASVMHIIANVDEVREIVNYLESQGVPVIDALNKLADRLGLPHWPTTYSNRFALRSTRSIRDFINEAKALLPVEKLVALALDKLANSESFQNLYMKISELDYQKLHNAALSHPEIVDLLARLNNLGVDTKKIWETIKSLFGWTY